MNTLHCLSESWWGSVVMSGGVMSGKMNFHFWINLSFSTVIDYENIWKV